MGVLRIFFLILFIWRYCTGWFRGMEYKRIDKFTIHCVPSPYYSTTIKVYFVGRIKELDNLKKLIRTLRLVWRDTEKKEKIINSIKLKGYSFVRTYEFYNPSPSSPRICGAGW